MLEADLQHQNASSAEQEAPRGLGRLYQVTEALKVLPQFQDAVWKSIFDRGLPFHAIEFDLGGSNYLVIPHGATWMEVETQVAGQDIKHRYVVYSLDHQKEVIKTTFELDNDGPRETRGAYVVKDYQPGTPEVIEEFDALLSKLQSPQ